MAVTALGGVLFKDQETCMGSNRFLRSWLSGQCGIAFRCGDENLNVIQSTLGIFDIKETIPTFKTV